MMCILSLALLVDCISAAAIIRKVDGKSRSESLQVVGVDANGQTVRLYEPGAWVASPFGDCISQCGSDDPKNTIAFRNRSIQCRSLQNKLLRDKACFDLRRPCAYQPCHCGLSLCIPKDCTTDTVGNKIPARVAKAEAECAENLNEYTFTCLGCYNLSFGDSIGEPTSKPSDRTCVSWTEEKGTTCRSGLPFYRMRSNALTTSLCFEYCTGLGFDLFGLVLDSECRCGASELNQVIWARANGTIPTHLKLPLPPPRACATPMDECPVRVYRFKGHFSSGGSIPAKLLRLSASSPAYIDSIVLGRNVSNNQEED